MSASRRFRDGAASGGGTRGGGGSDAERVVTRRARFRPPVERSYLGARRASTARGDRISESRPRSARRRVPDLEFGRGKWFASRGDCGHTSDVDPSGESDAAVWHLSHGIPRESWMCCERFFPGEERWGGRGYPQRRARANERATNGRERVDRRTVRAGDPIRPRRGTPTGRESAPAFTVR